MKPDDGLTLAIIRRPRYGCNDRDWVGLTFETYICENVAASQFLSVEDATKLIEESGVSDVAHLDGKPCWVKCEGNLITFVRYCKLVRP